MSKLVRNDGPLERAGEHWSRRLAATRSRRSFLGMVGGAGVTLAAGVELLNSEALATHQCSGGCCSGNSTTCYDYYHSNSCPSWTCECGYWDVCGTTTPPCGGSTPIKRWRDCCDGQCDQLRCCGGAPSCCNKKVYSQGCGTVGSTRIRCRYWTCHTTAAC
jgi:hypothetical protein